MAEIMRKFFEMNDLDVLIIAVLYFTSVIIGGIYVFIHDGKGKDHEK